MNQWLYTAQPNRALRFTTDTNMKMLQPHGETIPVESQPKLLVTVYYGRATFPNYQALDAFDPDAYRPLYRATHGKARGAQDPSL